MGATKVAGTQWLELEDALERLEIPQRQSLVRMRGLAERGQIELRALTMTAHTFKTVGRIPVRVFNEAAKQFADSKSDPGKAKFVFPPASDSFVDEEDNVAELDVSLDEADFLFEDEAERLLRQHLRTSRPLALDRIFTARRSIHKAKQVFLLEFEANIVIGLERTLSAESELVAMPPSFWRGLIHIDRDNAMSWRGSDAKIIEEATGLQIRSGDLSILRVKPTESGPNKRGPKPTLRKEIEFVKDQVRRDRSLIAPHRRNANGDRVNMLDGLQKLAGAELNITQHVVRQAKIELDDESAD